MQLPNRRELEKQLEKRVARLSQQHRKELRELLGHPPDFANVPEEFWQRIQREMDEQTLAILILLYGLSARSHIRAVGADYEPVKQRIMQQAQTYGRERSSDLAAKYRGGVQDAYNQRATEWQKAIDAAETATDGLGVPSDTTATPTKKPPKLTHKQVDDDLKDKVFTTGRAEKLSVNGTTEALSNGGEAGVGLTVGVSQDDLWINRPWLSRTGPCPICKPLHMTPRRVWGLRFPQGPGESVHSHCVCNIRYAAEKTRRQPR